MATYQELQEQIKKLQAQAEELRKNEISAVITDIKAKIAEYGLTAKDLGFSDSSASLKKTKDKLPAMYRGPEGKEWSGRGRQPNWTKGKNLDDFLIK